MSYFRSGDITYQGRVNNNASSDESESTSTYSSTRKAGKDPRSIVESRFMVTVNTNVTVDDDVAADEYGQQLVKVLENIGDHENGVCDWAKWFKLHTGGSKFKMYLDKERTKPNPNFDPEYNNFYNQDDKQGLEHWCSLIERLNMEGAGVEWAKGTKNRKNQYLHAHILISVRHRTRLQVDTKQVSTYFQDKMNVPHPPYVHVDYVANTTQKVLDYIFKNGNNKSANPELRAQAEAFFNK